MPGAAGKDVWFNCPKAKQCGGCQLAHLPYSAQLREKQRRVEALLGGFCPVSPILGMEDPLHYRAKVHGVVAADRQGAPFSGVYAAGTHRVVPVRRCLLEDERADAVIRTVVELAGRFRLSIWNDDTHRGWLRHVVVRVGARTGQLMAVLVASTEDFPQAEAFTAALVERHPDITTVVLNVNPAATSMVLGKRDRVLYGPGWIEDGLLGRVFRISPQSFYQVNSRQTEVLYRTAIGMAEFTGEETLLDAYCGTGTIGLCAADRVRRLIGVELNPDAVADARVNAERNGVANAEFIRDDAGRFMARAAREGLRVDAVVMDPPRTGSTETFLHALTALAPARVVYVSCDPETLARDLRVLVRDGWRVSRAVPVDMFPGTRHVETVVLLSRT